MHVSFHIGAHCTDHDQLIKSLLKNKGVMANHGVIVPGPSRYRGLLAQVINKLNGAPANADTQDMLLESMMDEDSAERLVLSHDNFLGAPKRALEGGQLYPLAERNSQRLRNLFPDNPVEFFLSLRNPASFVPAIRRLQPDISHDAFLTGLDPRALYWSDMVHAIREANPDCPITVWCNEDTPMIWPEVLHELSGLEPHIRLKGGLDIMAQITAKEGMKRLRSYFTTHPPQSEIQRRRVLVAFLDKYALDDEIEEELDLPGWTPELIDELTASYDDDMLEIARIPGVTLLTA